MSVQLRVHSKRPTHLLEEVVGTSHTVQKRANVIVRERWEVIQKHEILLLYIGDDMVH